MEQHKSAALKRKRSQTTQLLCLISTAAIEQIPQIDGQILNSHSCFVKRRDGAIASAEINRLDALFLSVSFFEITQQLWQFLGNAKPAVQQEV